MEAICTIITGDYGHYALALYDSILKFNASVHFYIFVSEGNLEENIKNEISKRSSISVLRSKDFKDSVLTEKLYDKYAANFHDALRWGMKSILMNYLLNSTYERVIYVDCDIHFFSDFSFLFEDLKTYNVLLSPHYRSSNPLIDEENFRLNFLDGIYNGGFVGASKQGMKALKYWGELCLFKCEINRNEGYYVDQRYLDILPTRFNGVGHIKHKGCNVANWNQEDCKRTKQEDSRVLINDKYPIVFIHFTKSFFRGVLNGTDTLLLPYLEEYRNKLLKYNHRDVISVFLEDEEQNKKRINTNKGFFLLKIIKKIKKRIISLYTKK